MASIKKLDSIVASRIAAGEVVERPASALRELVDNAIDAGSTKIQVFIEEGGIKSLTVIDNGKGMDKEDLSLACVSHATSKIQTLDDLFNIKSMGFRGEALASIASCSTLTIQSNGYKITVDNGIEGPILPGGIERGTSVSMENLFEKIPARKLFLKRPQSEASECKKILIEKALAFENIQFMFFVDGVLVLHLIEADKVKRCNDVFALDKNYNCDRPMVMSLEGDNVSLYGVASPSSCYKKDKSQIRIFVNNRVIDSFAFVQAVVNAYSIG
ncbi:MAG: ATP-binding protein, partial [Sphaerochaetaceae bacterium]|nr:ATP-binding protein [Sphaerochaetaceae bacterium]